MTSSRRHDLFSIVQTEPTPDFTARLAPSMGGDSHPFLDHGLESAWSPDGKKIVYHTGAPGDPIFIADRDGRDPKQIFVEENGLHCHFLVWSPDGRFIYFVKGNVNASPPDLDIWRIPSSGTASKPERMTFYNSRVAYPAWLDSRTLIYSGTSEDGAGQWLYAMDVEHRIPHRVSSGISEREGADRGKLFCYPMS